MLGDLSYLHNSLQANHPGFYRYTNEKEWSSIYESTKKRLEKPLGEIAFRMVLREYVANVQCGHTQVFPSVQSQKTYAKSKHFVPPFKVAFANNCMYVTQNESNDTNLVRGTQILSVNAHEAGEIISKIRIVQSADANLSSMKNYYGAAQFQAFYTAFYGEDSIYKLKVLTLKGDTQELVLKQDKENTAKKKVSKAKVTFKNINQKLGTFTLYGGDTQAAVIAIKGFQLNNADRFFEKAFEQINNQDVKYLVIDLRGNGGGSIMQAVELLKYLSKDTFSFSFVRGKQGLTYRKYAKEVIAYYITRLSLGLISQKTEMEHGYNYSFNVNKKELIKDLHFDGAIFCLVDNGSFSAASFSAAYLKYKANATIIGQETAGTESGCYAVNTPILELPSTRNFVRIPHYQFKHQLPVADLNKGVLPNITTITNAQTINSANDEELDLIWKLIFEKN